MAQHVRWLCTGNAEPAAQRIERHPGDLCLFCMPQVGGHGLRPGSCRYRGYREIPVQAHLRRRVGQRARGERRAAGERDKEGR